MPAEGVARCRAAWRGSPDESGASSTATSTGQHPHDRGPGALIDWDEAPSTSPTSTWCCHTTPRSRRRHARRRRQARAAWGAAPTDVAAAVRWLDRGTVDRERRGPDHRRHRRVLAERLAVRVRERLPVALGVDREHPRSHDIGCAAPELLDRSDDAGQRRCGLLVRVTGRRAVGGQTERAGNEDAVAHPDGTAVPDARLEGRTREVALDRHGRIVPGQGNRRFRRF